jgi:general secretion pathway protein H
MLTGFGEDSLRASARRLAGTVKYLYNEAALTGREHRLIYNLDRGTFRAARLEASGELKAVAGPGREQRLRGETRFRDVQVAARGKFSTGEVTTEILPVGWLPETVVHLDGGRGETLTVRLLPLTGDVEVYEGYREF